MQSRRETRPVKEQFLHREVVWANDPSGESTVPTALRDRLAANRELVSQLVHISIRSSRRARNLRQMIAFPDSRFRA